MDTLGRAREHKATGKSERGRATVLLKINRGQNCEIWGRKKVGLDDLLVTSGSHVCKKRGRGGNSLVLVALVTFRCKIGSNKVPKLYFTKLEIKPPKN